MREMLLNLQRFANAVSGTKMVYLLRLNEDEQTEDGACLAFTKENSRKSTASSETEATKDGSITTVGAVSKTLSCVALMIEGDERVRKFEKAHDEGKLFDIWEANLAAPVTPTPDPENSGGSGTDPEPVTKFKGTYFQGTMTSFEINSKADGFVELNYEFALNGRGEDGDVTVTVEQQETASYTFRDTPAGAPNGGNGGNDGDDDGEEE